MKTDLAKTAFVALGLVLAAAVQDMLPAFGGAKAPLLQVFALHVAMSCEGIVDVRRTSRRGHPQAWIWTSVAAGCFMEALSGLPLGSCIGFLLPACAIAHAFRMMAAEHSQMTVGMVAALVFAPLQEAWLDAWGASGGGPAIVRMFASAIPAAVVGAVMFALLPWLERFAGLREEETR